MAPVVALPGAVEKQPLYQCREDWIAFGRSVLYQDAQRDGQLFEVSGCAATTWHGLDALNTTAVSSSTYSSVIKDVIIHE